MRNLFYFYVSGKSKKKQTIRTIETHDLKHI